MLSFLIVLISAFSLLELGVCQEDGTEGPSFKFPPLPKPVKSELQCNVSKQLQEEIRSYESVVKQIFDTVLNGSFKGKLFKTVADYVDHHGHRISGSPMLEEGIDALEETIKSAGLKDVTTETFVMETWQRKEERAVLIKPRYMDMKILGLGGSVPTPPEGITAEVLVVRNFDELEKRAKEARGKIVVYDHEWDRYRTSVNYRVEGASRAADVGAVAALVRSVAPFSIDSPHTGIQSYSKNATRIPVAAITIEDSHLLSRIQQRGKKIVIRLNMGSESKNSTTRNTIVNYRGNSLPDQKVLVSGHIDSWDVGDGAMDDGAGTILSWFVPYVLQELGLRPRRTIQAVLFSGEEQGLIGAQAFRKKHLDDLKNYVIMMESDIGTFSPTGFSFSGSNVTGCILQEILKHLEPLKADELALPHEGSDIAVFNDDGVPRASLSTTNEKYFWFHHTEGDTITVENSDELDRCLAVWAVTTYIIADLSITLPRDVEY